mmetsp:Transcript_10422/g.28993  ORF Transcript_10422/g.28993 Transcript_10422/m.28993 type:complete len:445 (-) Transcript_10422:221-1555(-)
MKMAGAAGTANSGTVMKAKQVKKSVFTKQRGKIAILRPYKDLAGWEARRKREKPPPGGWPKPPAHWPRGVRVDVNRPVYWLPKGWGQGVKTTCVARLVAYVSPEGKCYYHRHKVEEVLGRKLGPDDSLEGAMGWAREQIERGRNWRAQPVKFAADARLFACLNSREKEQLADPDAFHFAVISARRAEDLRGIRNIVGVQAQLTACGVQPVWYVDAPSLKAYRNLGLTAVVGGKLVPARNKALDEARSVGKVCVQLSDDISHWDYLKGREDGNVGIAAGNEAAKAAARLRVSPLAATRFILAKMRGVPDGQPRPKLGGVFPLGNTGMSFAREAVSTDLFILGDFFVQDVDSPCRFDPRMTLKEDYDFTCTHLATHGAVLRCNRLMLSVTHETNAGGACSERDSSGEKERENIKVLKEKWPGVFHINRNRGEDDTQVIMCWRRLRR